MENKELMISLKDKAILVSNSNEADLVQDLLQSIGFARGLFSKGREYPRYCVVRCLEQGSYSTGTSYKGNKTVISIDELKSLAQPENISKTTKIDYIVDYFKKYLEGEKVQYRVKDTKQWHNLTPNSLNIFANTLLNLEFRVIPKKVEIDGVLMSKEEAIKYLNKHY